MWPKVRKVLEESIPYGWHRVKWKCFSEERFRKFYHNLEYIWCLKGGCMNSPPCSREFMCYFVNVTIPDTFSAQ